MKVSLEYAHTDLVAIAEHDIARSVECARLVADWLVGEGHEISTVILLDDKKVTATQAESGTHELLSLVKRLGYPAENWFFETHLRKWLPKLEALLPLKQRRMLQHDARSYLMKYGSLPCSVDIALWYTLRLGRLEDSPIEPCDVAVSVLGDGNVEFEDLARRNLLDHIGRDSVSNHVITLFYPEAPSTHVNTLEMLDSLAIAMKEIPNA